MIYFFYCHKMLFKYILVGHIMKEKNMISTYLDIRFS
jgi:hypothetical protein